jgi:hypothetical protein
MPCREFDGFAQKNGRKRLIDQKNTAKMDLSSALAKDKFSPARNLWIPFNAIGSKQTNVEVQLQAS